MCLPQISCTAILLAELLHACKIQLHRRGAAKNRYRDFQPAVVVVDLFHASIEIRKRPVHDTHLLVALKNHLGLRSEEHTSELQSQSNLVCRLLLEKKQIHSYSRPLPAKQLACPVLPHLDSAHTDSDPLIPPRHRSPEVLYAHALYVPCCPDVQNLP